MHFHHLLNFLQFPSLIVSIALSNFHLVFFLFIKNFFTIFLNWTSSYFAFPQASVAICRCPPERLLIVAHARTPSLVNAPICTVAFTAVSYKRPYNKHRSKHICAHFRMRLFNEALVCHTFREWGICFCIALHSLYMVTTEIYQIGP